VRTPLSTKLSLAALLIASPLSGQTREPEVWSYSFISEPAKVGDFLVNPGATGVGQPSRLSGYLTFDRPEDQSWSTGQYMVGLQVKVLAFAYRHDEFPDTTGYAQGDAYTLAFGWATAAMGIGGSRTWRTVGPAKGSWDLGWVARTSSGISAGLAWRDIGSPEVRGTTRHERLVAALTFRPSESRFSVSGQGDYRLDGGKFNVFRIGGSIRVIPSLDVMAQAEWNGDGDFEGFRIGGTFYRNTATVLGGAGLSQQGDARTATIGAAFDSPPRQ
jgi:hypothetical protein